MHRSARSSRTRVSSLPPSAPEVAMASPTSPSQAASSSLVSTAIYTSSVSTPQLVASTLASTSSALPSHLYASSLLASPIFLARVASPSLAPALPAMAVPVQRQPGLTSTRTNVNFSVEELSANPFGSGALDGSICWFVVKSSSSTPVACYNSRISASQCLLSSRTNPTSYHSRYAIFVS